MKKRFINFFLLIVIIGANTNGFAQKLIEQNSGEAMSLTKEMIGRVQERTLEEALEYAASMNAKARGTDDCKKGVTAFLNKEQIKW